MIKNERIKGAHDSLLEGIIREVRAPYAEVPCVSLDHAQHSSALT